MRKMNILFHDREAVVKMRIAVDPLPCEDERKEFEAWLNDNAREHFWMWLDGVSFFDESDAMSFMLKFSQ